MRRSSQRRPLLVLGGGAILALAIFALLNQRPPAEEPAGQGDGDNANSANDANAADLENIYDANRDGPPRGRDERSLIAGPVEDQSQILAGGRQPPGQLVGAGLQPAELYRLGLRLQASGKLIDARSVLSRALFSGQLTAAQASDARDKLDKLAAATLFAKNADFVADDPYTFLYVVQPGDMLQRLEVRLRLHVPHTLIMKVNRIDDATTIQPGDTLKMIRGPFHAVVDKSDFTMDIYLQREGLEKIYIKRVLVGLGKDDTTPAGMWRLELGGKAVRPRWDPPSRSGRRGPINYGEPGYPFGKLGLWIPLEWIGDGSTPFTSYGIHSTNKPETVGTMASLGCIRLRDGNIEDIFTLLYEKWSTVEVRP